MSDFGDISADLSRFLRRGEIEADSAFAPAPEAPPTVDAEAFKAAMRVLAAGVVMVTARRGDQLYGLTISACCSISASPPRVLISLAESASCLSAVLETRRFGLSILRTSQRPLAELGAVPGGPRRSTRSPRAGPASTMIAGALAHLDCAVHRTFRVSDHVLVIGDVEHAGSVPADELEEPGPLLYFNRTFHRLGEGVRVTERYDVVVVGSGINSLAGAALLAKAGRRVLVLEREDRLGGAIWTAEITEPGFVHEVLASWHPLFAGSAAYAELADDLDALRARVPEHGAPDRLAGARRRHRVPHHRSRAQRRGARAPRARGRRGVEPDRAELHAERGPLVRRAHDRAVVARRRAARAQGVPAAGPARPRRVRAATCS